MSSSKGTKISGATSDINVTPMADIMLVLLIIFMITTPLLQEGVVVNLAKASNAQVAPNPSSEDATTVYLSRDEKVYIGSGGKSAEVTLDQLQDRLIDAAKRSSDKPLFIKSDIAVKFGKVVAVVNKAREAGMERIGLLVDREEKGFGPARAVTPVRGAPPKAAPKPKGSKS
jgi:biopolymer transport protein ExbD